MESSPIKTVPVKLEIVVQKWRKHLFLFALLTRLGCRWSGLQREPQQHNLPSIIYQNEDGNLCLHCCWRSTCLFCCCPGWRQSIVCVACPASVGRMTRGASVMWLHFLSFLCEFFIACFLLFSTFSLWEIWGMNMPNLPEVSCLEDLVCCVRHACVAAIEAPLTMIVVVGWVSSWYSQCPHNAFVAFVGKAALWLCYGSLCCIRRTLVSWALWCFTIMASIAPITISDGFDRAHRDWRWRRCLLSLVVTVPSSNAYVVFTARIFNSSITIETEL